nr:UDP-N-acetylglucosamine 1-carboxyvinyltransferase [uncultured Blautia sp.]
MDRIHIAGGKPLHGSIRIQGSKNAALPMMAAALLYPGISILRNCPKIADVFCMKEILITLGAKIWWEEHDLYLDCTEIEKNAIPGKYTEKMRSSVILLGPLLGRTGKASMGYPGGCVIGKRPIDLHLYALRKFGAHIDEGQKYLEASCRKLLGTEVFFAGCSVGATEQAILTAVLAEGQTRIYNCAREPEVIWLCRFLKKMGAKIQGEGTDEIQIMGKCCLKGGDMQVPPDRIVAGTYLCAAAATRGKIEIQNAPQDELAAFLEVYRKMGGQYEWNSGKLLADGSQVRFSVPMTETAVYPGFPTDLQSPLMAVLATISGESRIREAVFEDRFKIAEELNRMGAQIRIEGREARIIGTSFLKGQKLRAQELRGGAALIIAALAAQGESIIEGYSFIHRGYENINQDISALGGKIKKDTGITTYEDIQQ